MADVDHGWLDQARVLRWLQLDATSQLAQDVDDVRRAAADWCEDQRRDLIDSTTTPATFTATERVMQAGVLAAARLWARRSSPAGLASYAELGAAEILRLDPDVTRLLGTGRYAAPQVG